MSYIYRENEMLVHCRPNNTTFKTGWKRVTDERILKIYQQVVNRCIELGWLEKAEFAPPLYTSSRMTRALGTCWQKRTQWGYYAKDGIPTVEALIVVTSDIVKYPDVFAAGTLIHELAHATCPIGEKHSWRWERRGNIIAQAFPGVKIQRYASAEEVKIALEISPKKKREWKYQLVCPKCGREFTKYRTICASLQRPRWSCGVCHVNLGYKILATGEFKEIR